MSEKLPFQPVNFAIFAALRVIIGGLLLLPYKVRVPVCGWIVSRIIAPLAGYDRRIRENLAYIMPDMPEDQVKSLMRQVPDTVGRTMIEVYSGKEFKKHAADTPILGEGMNAILQARQQGRGVLLISGHFGNYDVPRAVLSSQGHNVAALYKPFSNPYFDRFYREKITAIGAPIFPKGRRGMAEMVKHLRAGGLMGMLIDQRMVNGAPLEFFGKPALTATNAAEMALKYNLLLVPVYGLRGEDGLSFQLVTEKPIAYATPEQMTQSLNDSLERITRQHMDQWFWIHRRWK
jgi:Kdo2-lipid IVA lauroyltransferase/acyltransferase